MDIDMTAFIKVEESKMKFALYYFYFFSGAEKIKNNKEQTSFSFTR